MNEHERFASASDELKAKLPIDIHTLHLNVKEQPELACNAGEEAAEAKAEARRRKMLYESACGETEKLARIDPQRFGIEKVTENAIKSAMTTNGTVIIARGEMIESERLAELAAAVANAFEHRRAMLKIEVELYLSNYWGDIEVKERAAGHEHSQIRKDTESKLKQRRKKRIEDADEKEDTGSD